MIVPNCAKFVPGIHRHQFAKTIRNTNIMAKRKSIVKNFLILAHRKKSDFARKKTVSQSKRSKIIVQKLVANVVNNMILFNQ